MIFFEKNLFPSLNIVINIINSILINKTINIIEYKFNAEFNNIQPILIQRDDFRQGYRPVRNYAYQQLLVDKGIINEINIDNFIT